MSRAPWVSHFGFTRTPFSKTIPASQLCDRASHQEAVARMRFCIAESLLGVITGEVGVGKTVAVRATTSQLEATAHHIIYVATPTFGARGLYLTIVHALGAKPRAQKADLIAQTQTLLAAEEHERRRRVVVVIDEAHLLAPDQLEELRLLTNAEMDSQSPFALLLVGQPTLARQLRLGVFAALDQRIATRYQLAPMTWPKRRNTSATTWPWSVVPIRCLPMTPSRGCTSSVWGCHARSTTPPSPHSSPRPPQAKRWSMTIVPRKRSPNSLVTRPEETDAVRRASNTPPGTPPRRVDAASSRLPSASWRATSPCHADAVTLRQYGIVVLILLLLAAGIVGVLALVGEFDVSKHGEAAAFSAAFLLVPFCGSVIFVLVVGVGVFILRAVPSRYPRPTIDD